MDFAHLRQDKAQKTPYSQKGMNLLPLWTYARSTEFSNFQSTYGDIATELGDIQRSLRQGQDNQTATLNNLWYKGEVYSHVVDPSFVFQYRDLRDSVEYITPTITGTRGVNTYTLQNVKDNAQRYLTKGVPFATDTPVLTYAVADLPAPISGYTILGSSGDGTEIVIPEDNYIYLRPENSTSDIGESIGGIHYLASVTIRNKRYPDQFYTYFPYVTSRGLRSAYPLPAGTYIVDTDLLTDDTTLYIDTWSWQGIFPELSYGYYDPDNRRESIWSSDSDPGYLNLWVPPYGGAAQGIGPTVTSDVAKTFVLMDDVGVTHEAGDLAKPDYMPIILALSNETDNLIHVYNTYLDQATELHVDNTQPLLDLNCEVIDYRIGDEIVVNTRRAADFMDTEISAVRLRVVEDYTSTTKYLQRDGSVVSASEAWVPVNTSLSRYKEQRWRFTVTDVGTHTFYLEVKPKAQDPVETATYIIHVGYKEALAAISVDMPLGRTLQRIAIWTDGKLYGYDDLSNIYEIPLLYNDFFINYDEYVVYTLSEFDYLELTY